MKNLGLQQYESELIKNLSLGTQQKVSFITSFMSEPELLLIDEPFANFDKKSLKIILSFISEYIKETKSIIIFSTHLEYTQIKELISHNIHISSNNQLALVKCGGSK